jgi:glycosyltransferase involved in cell wall biosynthesis
MKPAVSVVIPTYNRAHSIERSIASVLRQTFEDFELIVVDDGSTDGTQDLVRAIADPRVRLVSMPKNGGPGAARNMGIREAVADWVAFQDSDDEWLPEKLERQMERTREKDANWVAVYCGMVTIGSVIERNSPRNQIRFRPGPDIEIVEGDIRASLFRTSFVSAQMLLARKSVLETIGGFDETFRVLEDWDLALRLAALGPFAFVDQPLVLQRFSVDSVTRDGERWVPARAKLYEKHHAAMAGAPVILAEHYRSLSGSYRRWGEHGKELALLTKAHHLHPGGLSAIIRLWQLRLAAMTIGLRQPTPSEPIDSNGKA